jgi:hypothetical protein
MRLAKPGGEGKLLRLVPLTFNQSSICLNVRWIYASIMPRTVASSYTAKMPIYGSNTTFMITPADPNIDVNLQAFIATYFSNYIEGTEFEIEEAHVIVVQGRPLGVRVDVLRGTVDRKGDHVPSAPYKISVALHYAI